MVTRSSSLLANPIRLRLSYETDRLEVGQSNRMFGNSHSMHFCFVKSLRLNGWSVKLKVYTRSFAIKRRSGVFECCYKTCVFASASGKVEYRVGNGII